MKTIKNKGFTIIELMIAVAILGILAAIAIPSYQNYIIRAKVSEAISFASMAKTAVSEYTQSQGMLPANNSLAGLAAPKSISSTNVQSLSVASGIITVQTSISGITNFGITFTPTVTSAGINWACSTDSSDDYAYVPSNCRNTTSGQGVTGIPSNLNPNPNPTSPGNKGGSIGVGIYFYNRQLLFGIK